MTVKKYTRSLLEYVLKRYKIKNMQVSLRSNCFAHRYFKAWLSLFFPNRGTAKTRLPLTETLNKWVRQWYKDSRDIERLSEGRRQQEQGEESQNRYFDKKKNIHSLRSISQVFDLISFGSFIDSDFAFSFYPIVKNSLTSWRSTVASRQWGWRSLQTRTR